MTKEERLAKASRHAVQRPARKTVQTAPSDVEDIVKKELLKMPVRLDEALACRGKNYFQRS